MSLIQEYGQRKEQKGSSEVIVAILKSGMSAEEISQRIEMPLEDILKIKEKYL